jgi:hypothetical protein
MEGITDLKAFLEMQPPGPVLDADACRLKQLLSSCWHDFAGSSETNMYSGKIWRIEDPEWHSPILSFSIERHAQTVMGSTRASLYEWSLDIENRTAEIVRERKRQLRPNAKRLDVKAIAQTLADAIISGRSDERAKIGSDGRVKAALFQKQTRRPRRLVEKGFDENLLLFSNRVDGSRFVSMCMNEVRASAGRGRPAPSPSRSAGSSSAAARPQP